MAVSRGVAYTAVKDARMKEGIGSLRMLASMDRGRFHLIAAPWLVLFGRGIRGALPAAAPLVSESSRSDGEDDFLQNSTPSLAMVMLIPAEAPGPPTFDRRRGLACPGPCSPCLFEQAQDNNESCRSPPSNEEWLSLLRI